MALLEDNDLHASREIADKMNYDRKTALNHLHLMWFSEKLGASVLHDLCESKKKQHLHRAAINDVILYQIITWNFRTARKYPLQPRLLFHHDQMWKTATVENANFSLLGIPF